MDISQYCHLEQLCYQCFKEDPQDLVKLHLGLCYICDKEKWNDMKASISKEVLLHYIETAPKDWKELYLEELKNR